jgi:hypothetical protein
MKDCESNKSTTEGYRRSPVRELDSKEAQFFRRKFELEREKARLALGDKSQLLEEKRRLMILNAQFSEQLAGWQARPLA